MVMGRPFGALSRSTLEKREHEARIAKKQIADARKNKDKLAKEVMVIFMHQFANLAARYQRIAKNQIADAHKKLTDEVTPSA